MDGSVVDNARGGLRGRERDETKEDPRGVGRSMVVSERREGVTEGHYGRVDTIFRSGIMHDRHDRRTENAAINNVRRERPRGPSGG